ncbi:MAG: hypothetical protein KDD01_19930, partial [Phaeodactylibacter sp.]|nr:hypothetical protein [Phaeodactylibacter sp.]
NKAFTGLLLLQSCTDNCHFVFMMGDVFAINSLEHVWRWCFGGENDWFWVLMRLIFERIAALWARK